MTAPEFIEEFCLRLRVALAGATHTQYTSAGFEAYKAVVLGIFEEMGVKWENATWVTDGVVSYGHDLAIATGDARNENPIQPDSKVEPLVGSMDPQKPHEPGA